MENFRYMATMREAMQSAPFSNPHQHPDQRIADPDRLPPAYALTDAVHQLVSDLADYPHLLLELPTPMSCPSAAHFSRYAWNLGRQWGVVDRMPTHVRLTPADIKLALDAGATAIHGMGNASSLAGIKGKRPEHLLQVLRTNIEPLLSRYEVHHFRASLEQALHTSVDDVGLFVRGLRQANEERLSMDMAPMYSAVGIPDTNGDGTPEQFIHLIDSIADDLYKGSLTVFVHLHNDNGLYIQNAQAVIERCQMNGIPVVIEFTPDQYPGERTGIVTHEDLPSINRDIVIPASSYTYMTGSSWKDGISEFGEKKMVIIAWGTNVAGIHTDHKFRYGDGNGVPAAGLYSIMGKANLEEIRIALGLPVWEVETLQQAALIGRELGFQDKHLKHQHAIALVRLAIENSGLLEFTAQKIGKPETWLNNPTPDLNEIRANLHLPLNKSRYI